MAKRRRRNRDGRTRTLSGLGSVEPSRFLLTGIPSIDQAEINFTPGCRLVENDDSGAHAWFRIQTDEQGRAHLELAADDDGEPGAWGTDPIGLGDIAPMSAEAWRAIYDFADLIESDHAEAMRRAEAGEVDSFTMMMGYEEATRRRHDRELRRALAAMLPAAVRPT